MPEIRHNIIPRQWVIISTERARRPDQFASEEKLRVDLPARVATCPFCPGNEAKTPPETFRDPPQGPWRVRVVPNKFGALSSEGQLVRMMRAYLARYHAVLADERVEQVTLFKNHGLAAGTSLEHPHSQLIGTPVIPSEVMDRLTTALQFYDESGQCLFCTTLAEEMDEGTRVVVEGQHFVAFIPFAALSPFHLWIFPKRHSASFGNIEPAELADLARVLRALLAKLHKGLNDPDYNFTIRTAP